MAFPPCSKARHAARLSVPLPPATSTNRTRRVPGSKGNIVRPVTVTRARISGLTNVSRSSRNSAPYSALAALGSS